jgi:hypothetical protein
LLIWRPYFSYLFLLVVCLRYCDCLSDVPIFHIFLLVVCLRYCDCLSDVPSFHTVSFSVFCLLTVLWLLIWHPYFSYLFLFVVDVTSRRCLWLPFSVMKSCRILVPIPIALKLSGVSCFVSDFATDESMKMSVIVLAIRKSQMAFCVPFFTFLSLCLLFVDYIITMSVISLSITKRYFKVHT